MAFDLSRYLADQHHTGSTWWLYRFPSGRSASVEPDARPEHPFRFEVQVDDQQPMSGLTSDQVEAKLAEVYALPKPELIVAWVNVDERGHLIPWGERMNGSTVTVGDDTWSVPNKVEHGGVLWMSRVSYALREFGWRPANGADHDFTRPGVIGVPVERIDTKE